MEQDESLKVQVIRAVVVTVLILAGLAALRYFGMIAIEPDVSAASLIGTT